MNPVRRRLPFAVLIAWLASSSVVSLSAQAARVAGVVVDGSGGAVADAAVSVSETGAGPVLASGRTDSSGAFSLRVAAPGTYRLVVEAAGFERVERTVSAGPATEPALRIALVIAPLADQLRVVGDDGGTGYVATSTVSATKMATPLLSVPQSVTVLPATRIQDLRPLVLNEVLHQVAGVADTGSRRGFDFPNIRGFDASASNVFLDGLRVERGNFNVPQELSALARVEVLKGPAAMLFGQGPPGGIVNQISRAPSDRPVVDIAVGGGAFGLGELLADLGGPVGRGGTAYRLGLALRTQDDFVDFVSKDRLYLAPSLRNRFGTRTTVTWTGTYTRDRKDGNFVDLPAVGTVLPNINGPISRKRYAGEPGQDRLAVDRTQAGYRFTHLFGGWALQQHLRASFSDVLSAGASLTTVSGDGRRVSRLAATFDQDERALAVDTQLTRGFRTGRVVHTVLVGVDYYGQRIDQVFSFGGLAPLDLFAPVYGATPVASAPVLDFKRRDRLIGGYVQDQATIGAHWTVLAGLRIDSAATNSVDRLRAASATQTDVALVPRVGVIYRVASPLSVYAGYGQGFNPSFGVSSGGESFEPETGEQVDAGVKIALGGHLSGSVAVYELTRDRVLVADPSAPGFSQAVGRQRSRGVEAEVVWQETGRVTVTGSYGYTDVSVLRDSVLPPGTRARSVPRHAGSAWVRASLWAQGDANLSAGVGGRLIGEREGTLPNTYRLPGYGTIDVAAFARKGRWRLHLNLLNALDEAYIASASPVGPANVLLGEPRTLRATLGWTW